MKKVEILCRFHKSYFWQTPMDHLTGRGCPDCRYLSASKTGTKLYAKSFKRRARKIHGNKYGYSRFVYKNINKKGEIFCRFHKEYFWQNPKGHLKGKGCEKCGVISGAMKQTGFKKSWELNKTEKIQPCDFYYLKFKIGKKLYFKIGISKRVNLRIREIENKTGLKVNLVFTHKTTRFKAMKIEEKILKDLRDFRIFSEIKFKGSYECFGMDILGLTPH